MKFIIVPSSMTDMNQMNARRKRMTPKLAWLLALALVAACEPTYYNRGNILDADKLAQIKPGSTTREEVATELGTPTEVGTFDDKTWYYVGRQTKQYSFLDPEVLKQKAVEIKFDDNGVVTQVADLDLSQAEDVAMAPGATPTYGKDDTFITQLLNNLAHPVPMAPK